MNRRNFLKSLTAVAAANIFLPRAGDAFRWKQRETGVWVLNPAYVTAPYVIDFCYEAGPFPLATVTPFVRLRQPGEPTYRGRAWVRDTYPFRLDADRNPVPVMLKIKELSPLTFS